MDFGTEFEPQDLTRRRTAGGQWRHGDSTVSRRPHPAQHSTNTLLGRITG